MLNLVVNESRKLNRQMGTWVMRILVVLLILAAALIAHFDSDNDQKAGDWKTELIQTNKENEKQLKDEKLPESLRYLMQKEIDINNYRLENDHPPSRIWEFVNITSALVSVITIFSIIVAAGSISKEFSWGTIKLLMIRPVNRSKMLLSKYLSTFLFVLELLFILFVFSIIIGGLFFGFDNLSTNFLTYTDGKVNEENPVIYILKTYGLNCISLLIMTTFAFMISTLFRTSSLAIGVSIVLVFTGSTIVGIFSKYEWSKYILFANTQLSQYIDGSQIQDGMSLQFSLTVVAVYYVVFMLLSWIPFVKRDIAG
ncbi:ABC transporter permease [Bacillus sp. T33-2]|uniref:ABC transporter permease n=1 Tax=Bacillus sp. T33-2 TaxID=2054168 RepID=UPI000C77EBF1|nr:ABC transporter permease [Bacillus sp. T33-2]PLR91100.1 hypothetical protein CVD19_22080 [Bacillus sp. T33-2]